MSTITTYTRKHFDPVHPAPELLCVEDFAHALPMVCRGNGHVMILIHKKLKHILE